MKSTSFFHGAGVAAALAFLASVSVAALAPILAFSLLHKLLIPALGLAYILYLFSRSHTRTGRVTCLAIWLAFTISTWVISPPLTLYILLHVSAIWLVRSLYYYSSTLPALLDLGLNLLGTATAFWAISHSGSIFLATWCFFLTQALFVLIPCAAGCRHKAEIEPTSDSDNFEQAQRRAESAIRALLAQ